MKDYIEVSKKDLTDFLDASEQEWITFFSCPNSCDKSRY